MHNRKPIADQTGQQVPRALAVGPQLRAVGGQTVAARAGRTSSPERVSINIERKEERGFLHCRSNGVVSTARISMMNVNVNGNGYDTGDAILPRALPADINAERATLGAILLERDAIIGVADWLTPDHFYLEKHAWIYEAMLACYNRRVPPDISTVAGALRAYAVPQRRTDAEDDAPKHRLSLVGGIAYLGELSAEVPTAVHVEYYGRMVERTAILRRLIACGGKITALGYDEREDLEKTLDKAESELFRVAHQRTNQDFRGMDVLLDHYVNEQARLRRQVPTGFPDLDRMLGGGLSAGELVILAARPSVGKSALAQTILWHTAIQQRYAVGLAALEMSVEQIADRLVAMETGVNLRQVPYLWRSDDDTDSDIRARMITAVARCSVPTAAIDEGSATTVLALSRKARRLMAERGLDLLIIDYLQLMQADPGTRIGSRVEEVSQISRHLKLLARELNIPILALSQLSRAVEGRTSKIPTLSDLRESGALEQDADKVLFIYREEMYDKKTENKGVAEVHIAKNRNGPLGTVLLRYDAPTTRFQSLAREPH